jgi:hypothetical protein
MTENSNSSNNNNENSDFFSDPSKNKTEKTITSTNIQSKKDNSTTRQNLQELHNSNNSLNKESSTNNNTTYNYNSNNKIDSNFSKNYQNNNNNQNKNFNNSSNINNYNTQNSKNYNNNTSHMEFDQEELNNKILGLLQTMSPHNVQSELIRQGYPEKEIHKSIGKIVKNEKSIIKTNAHIILFKDFFDKIGYGFASHLVMFIFLAILKTPIAIIGLISGIKSFITLNTSSYLKAYDKKFNINKRLIATFGVLFGFTFLFKAAAISLNSATLFAIGMIAASVFIVLHGELYSNYVIKKLIRARSNITSRLVGFFSLMITAISFIGACTLLNKETTTINLISKAITMPSYLLAFEIIAFAFILSSYAFSFVKPENNITKSKIKKQEKKEFIKNYITNIIESSKNFLEDINVRTIFLGALFSGSIQTTISTFSGIYVYNHFQALNGNGFLSVGLIFGIGIICAMFAPHIARSMMKIFGETPILVFSVFLIAIFPISLYFNLTLAGLIITHAIAVIGGASLSIVQSKVIQRSLNDEERRIYFSAITPIISVFLPIIVIIFSIIAGTIGLRQMFLILAVALILLITPFYFVLVIKDHKKHNKTKFN